LFNIQNLASFFFIFKIFPVQKYTNVCLDQLIDANSLHTQCHCVVGLFATSPTSKGITIKSLNTKVNLNYL